MAALQSIRSRGKLIAVCVGGALLAFVLGDFINSGATIFGASQTKIGDINGESLDYNEFMSKVDQRETFMKLATGRSTLDAQTTDEIRDYCWEQEVRKNTIGKFLEKQGLRTTDDEIVYMINSGNVTPFMRQAFANPETGVFEPARVTAYMSQNDPESRFIWQTLENELRDSRDYVKYVSMVSSGLYVTKAEVENEFKNRTHISDFKYVALPLSEVKDDEIAVTESALKDYYSKNQNAFQRIQETRDIAYVSFDVIPTKEDSTAVLESVNKIRTGLQEADAADVKDFINSRSSTPFSNYHYNDGEIENAELNAQIFASQPGFVYGPYVEGEYYKLARLVEFKNLADSVKASHILLVVQNPADSLSVKAKADSLMGVLKSGIDFAALATANSQDPGSAREGGDLGWITESTPFIPEFKNACFSTEKGQVTLVKSAYGYHIIKVTDKTQVKRKASVGFVSVEIRPSKQTRSAAYVKASEFAGKNRTLSEFEKGIEEGKLLRRVAPNLTSNTRQIPGIENSRELVRWAFDNEKSKEVSQIMEFGDRYVVAALTGVHKKGIANLEAVKQAVAVQVSNSLKGDKLAEKLSGQSSVDAAAAQFGKPVQEAHAVNFEMVQIPGIGFEPAVIAAASALGENQTSAPVKGNNAVYLLQNTSYTPSQEIQPLNITTDRKQLENELRYRASYQIVNAVNQLVEIDDRRVKFF
jgi:peptidyl-prolyl cis-trans isomerase D